MGAIANKIKGKLKKAEGRMTGDPIRTAEGSVQDAAGSVGAKVKAGVARAKLRIAEAKAKAKLKVKARAVKTKARRANRHGGPRG